METENCFSEDESYHDDTKNFKEEELSFAYDMTTSEDNLSETQADIEIAKMKSLFSPKSDDTSITEDGLPIISDVFYNPEYPIKPVKISKGGRQPLKEKNSVANGRKNPAAPKGKGKANKIKDTDGVENRNLPAPEFLGNGPNKKPRKRKSSIVVNLRKVNTKACAKVDGKENVSKETKKKRQSRKPEQSNNPNSLQPPTNATSPGKRKRSPKAILNQNVVDEHLSELQAVFPNVDPNFLKSKYMKMKGDIENTVETVMDSQKSGKLPLKEDSLRMSLVEKIENKFVTEFSVEEFLKVIPDPWTHFLNMDVQVSYKYADHSLFYLKNKYKLHYNQTIQDALIRNDYSLYRTDKELSDKRKTRTLKMRSKVRSKKECESGKPANVDFKFLQEVAFIEHENEIANKTKNTITRRSKLPTKK